MISAKLSNCWKPLRALDTTTTLKRVVRTSRNGVGIVKILEIGQSAAKSFVKHDMEKVQRLNGSWDILKIFLRYSLLLCESKGMQWHLDFLYSSNIPKRNFSTKNKYNKIDKFFKNFKKF